MIDSGTSAIFSRPNRKCSAKLVKIDLNASRPKLEIVHTFPEMVISKNSVIMHMVIDMPDFHFSDIVLGRLVKFNILQNKSIVIESDEQMRPVSSALDLEGHAFHLHFGVVGLAMPYPVNY